MPKACTELLEAMGHQPRGHVDEQDLPPPDWSKRLECPRELPLDIQRPGEPTSDVRGQVDG